MLLLWIFQCVTVRYRASPVAQLGICLQCRRPRFDSWVGKILWRRDRLPTPIFLGFPCGSAGKESACNAGDLGSILGLGGSPGEGKGYPLQYSGLQNSMDSSPWGRKESDTTEQTWLSGGMSVCSPSLHSSGFMNAFPEGSSCYISRDWVCLIWCSELRKWHCYLLRIQ